MFNLTLQDGETILGVYRQSKTILAKPLLLALVLVIVPVYFLYKYGLLFDYIRFVAGWAVLVAIYVIYKTLVWNLNVLLITNKRFIHANYKTLFKKEIFESPWHRVANIGFRSSGVTASLFRFGDLSVHVNGLPSPVIVSNMPKTGELKDVLWKVHTASVGSHFS